MNGLAQTANLSRKVTPVDRCGNWSAGNQLLHERQFLRGGLSFRHARRELRKGLFKRWCRCSFHTRLLTAAASVPIRLSRCEPDTCMDGCSDKIAREVRQKARLPRRAVRIGYRVRARRNRRALHRNSSCNTIDSAKPAARLTKNTLE